MESCFTKLLEYINACSLPKLSKEFFKSDSHAEYRIRINVLHLHFPQLLYFIRDTDFSKDSKLRTEVLAHLLIFYLELKSVGCWNSEHIRNEKYSEKLSESISHKLNINLDEVLSSDCIDAQEIFDTCMHELHKKLTSKDLKKYPSLIEVYCLLIKDVNKYKINLNPLTVLPIALLLIDDFIITNKVKGLKSCTAVLQCLTPEEFTAGNYYEVVYNSLNKIILKKDKEVTQALFECFMEFLEKVPLDIKKSKLDDIFSNLVDILLTETNLPRKADCFHFITKIIEMHGIHCVKKKVLKDIICDNIDICSNESVSDMLLPHVLECLQTWIRYCWCTWKLSTGHKILSSLFKILYTTKEEYLILEIQNIIITLIKLCTEKEQIAILKSLQEPMKCSNHDYIMRLEAIKDQINI